MLPIALATEDELSEAIGLRLIAENTACSTGEPMRLRKDGFGYLKSGMKKWLELARQRPVLLLTDLDQKACPVLLREEWLAGASLHSALLFRVAVREIESWVLADHAAIRQLIGSKGRLPEAPDELPDPKQYLLQLARQAPRDVRQDLVRIEGRELRQGLGYNRRLAHWVKAEWNPARAAERSPSLHRARAALTRYGQEHRSV